MNYIATFLSNQYRLFQQLFCKKS